MLFFKKLNLLAVAVVASLPMLALPTLRITDTTSGSVQLLNLADNGTDLGASVPGGGGVSDTSTGVPFLGLVTTPSTIFQVGGINTWLITFSGGTTKPFDGTALNPLMTLNANIKLLSTASGSSRKLKIEFSENNFQANPFSAMLTTTTNAPNRVVQYGVLYDDNTDVDGGTLFAGSAFVPTYTSDTSDGGDVKFGGPIALNPFSLTMITEVTLAKNQTVNTDMLLAAVPEPGFYGALALGLSGLFAAVARRRSAAKV